MRDHIRLTHQDIQVKQENALDLYYSGIKSEETKRTMTLNLKIFLLKACTDFLRGDLREATQQFVDLAKEDQEQATRIILAYVQRLKERTTLPKADPSYLNPSSIPNKIKPIRKLLEMNNLGLGWKRIYSTYPELDNTHQGRGYSRSEIKKMLEYSTSIQTDFVILASSSGGLRVGAWDGLTWGDVFPIYEKDGVYSLDNPNNDSRIVCGAMKIYRRTPSEYIALISKESWNKLTEYEKAWSKKMKREPGENDPLLLERYDTPTPMTSTAVKRKIEGLLKITGIRQPLLEGNRRHEVPVTHGFRRYWNKVMMETQRNRNTLAALVIKERLMGHGTLVKTDKNYFWTEVLDLVPIYLQAVSELMINDEARLEKKLEDQKLKSSKLETANKEKELALEKLAELEAKVTRIIKCQSPYE